MGRIGSVAAMLSADGPPLNDLTDEQIQKLLGGVAPKMKKLMEGVTLAIDYHREGGCDRETWNRICDGLSREAMNLMMTLSGRAHPSRLLTPGRGHSALPPRPRTSGERMLAGRWGPTPAKPSRTEMTAPVRPL